MSNLNTFIPAGGLGSRLMPHTRDIPKPMLLMGSPYSRTIDYPLQVSRVYANHTWVSTDYLADDLEKHLELVEGVTVLRDTNTVGSAGSLMMHYDKISMQDSEGDTLILPSDHIYENFDIGIFHDSHRETEADISLLTVPPKQYGEYVMVDSDEITAVEIMKDYRTGAKSTTGIFIFSNQFLINWLIRNRRSNTSEQLNIYNDIVCPSVGSAALKQYFMSEDIGYWEDVGTLARYHACNMKLSREANVIASDANIPDSTLLVRCVVLNKAILPDTRQISDAIISTDRQGQTHITQLGRNTGEYQNVA